MRGTRNYFGKTIAVMQKRGYIVKCLWAVALVGAICYSELAKAGITGLISGTGKGFAGSWLNLVSTNSTSAKSQVQTLQGTQSPSAAIPPTAGFLTNAAAPTGAASGSYSRVVTLAGGILQGQHYVGSSGNGFDNPELDARVHVVPGNCVAMTISTSIDTNEFQINGNSGKMTVVGTGTTGTAFWLRGFEYTGDPRLIPSDDPNTVQNEAIEFFKTNEYAVWKFETVVLGPFDFNSGCPLIIPFTLDSSNLANLYFSVDTTGQSIPFSIQCPANLTPSCTQTVHYPPIQVSGGCGNTALSFSVPDGTTFPLGTTPVTVTATDQSGNTASCGFNVTVTDTNAPVPPPLSDIISATCNGTGVTPITPVASDNCPGSVLGKTTNQFPITAIGTNLVYWTFTDPSGNTSTATQRVIITGITFVGFYPPIAGINGSCTAPVEVINSGSKNPIKFDMKCGNTLITSGPLPLVRLQHFPNCQGQPDTEVDANAVYNNDWHFNWDTTGYAKGVWKITVVMPDKSSAYVFVIIK